jgi:cytochrome b6-f complex iron-sulfur subunit
METPDGKVTLTLASSARRSFLARLMAGTLFAGAAGIVSAIVAYLFPPDEVRSSLGPQRVRVGRVDDLELGEGKLVLVDDEPVWVVRLASGFVGFSGTCTHKGCMVKWERSRKLFQCPCHDGLFDQRGNVASGLPRRSLTHYRVGLVRGDVYVSRADNRST